MRGVYFETFLRLTATAQRIDSPINTDGKGLAISTKEKSKAKPVLKRLKVITKKITENKIFRFKLIFLIMVYLDIFD
jgi:hypothetical protein